MLFATAKSVREEVSKQRNALQDFTRLNISLIKGKAGWRVGSVEALQNDFSLASSKEVRGSVVLFYRLLRRFIRGEEAHSDLFDFSIAALDEILKPQTNRRLLDLFIETRILLLLGYVDQKAVPEAIRTSTLADISALENPELTKKLETLVNKAREISHL